MERVKTPGVEREIWAAPSGNESSASFRKPGPTRQTLPSLSKKGYSNLRERFLLTRKAYASGEVER